LGLHHENKDYIFRDKYWNNRPGLHEGQLGKRRSGIGTTYWPRKFNSMEEMINPFIPEQQIDHDETSICERRTCEPL
jgi:hypothetical protein